MTLLSYLTPRKLMQVAEGCIHECRLVATVSLSIGLYMALVMSPPDYQQGEAVRMMYVHVPASWLALAIYTFMTIFSIIALTAKLPAAHIVIKAAAPFGAGFTLISLLTGMLWGKPMWGAWWVWDARLTSVLALFLLYVGYLAMVKAMTNHERAQQIGAWLIVIGCINIPIIKWSVDWWNTLHQTASFMRFKSPALPGSMIVPLLVMTFSFLSFFVWGLMVRIQNEILARRLQALELNESPSSLEIIRGSVEAQTCS